MHAGVLGRSSWGGSSTLWKEPSNSLLTIGIASTSYCWQPSHASGSLWRSGGGFSGSFRAWCLGYLVGGGYSPNSSLFSRGPRTTVSVIHKEARHQLLDLQLLAHDLANRPTRIAEVLPQWPTYVGCCDAAKPGMGGVWLPSAQHPLHPRTFGRPPFPSSVQQALVSTDNPSGSITNSDLELAGTIAHEATLPAVHDIRHCTIATFSDNTPAVPPQNQIINSPPDSDSKQPSSSNRIDMVQACQPPGSTN